MKRVSIAVVVLLAVLAGCTTSDKNAETTKLSDDVESVVTFSQDIKPLLQEKCSPCHAGGNQVTLTQYDNAKAKIDAIIDRINREEGSSGFMPRGRDKLSAPEINLFESWRSAGIVE